LLSRVVLTPPEREIAESNRKDDEEITQQSQVYWPYYQVNAVSLCGGTEGVNSGTPPANWVTILQNAGLSPTGANAISYDMTNAKSAARCLKRH
jgi:hypothetical protein